MSKTLWLERWQKNHIGFHQNEVNRYLKRHLDDFDLMPTDTILMPLCGRALDIAWLSRQGFQVVGVELSGIAIRAFFDEFGLTYRQFQSGHFQVYESTNIRLFEGDFFDLQAEDIGPCKLVYDRAALIALDGTARRAYCAHMQAITHCDMLLIALHYDQSILSGPPFSVTQQALIQYYQQRYRITHLETHEVLEERPDWRKKGLKSLTETAYRIDVKPNL